MTNELKIEDSSVPTYFTTLTILQARIISIVSGRWKYHITKHTSFQLPVQRCYTGILKSAVVGIFVEISKCYKSGAPPSPQLVKHLSAVRQPYENGTFSFYR